MLPTRTYVLNGHYTLLTPFRASRVIPELSELSANEVSSGGTEIAQ